ncbi:MAG: hypothetical protein JW839_21145 [Candidatus Lokiarchaeota archaeon]|nr:hypothetical protein [Candidatus Lokiarchaeota archaeon]
MHGWLANGEEVINAVVPEAEPGAIAPRARGGRRWARLIYTRRKNDTPALAICEPAANPSQPPRKIEIQAQLQKFFERKTKKEKIAKDNGIWVNTLTNLQKEVKNLKKNREIFLVSS